MKIKLEVLVSIVLLYNCNNKNVEFLNPIIFCLLIIEDILV